MKRMAVQEGSLLFDVLIIDTRPLGVPLRRSKHRPKRFLKRLNINNIDIKIWGISAIQLGER